MQSRRHQNPLSVAMRIFGGNDIHEKWDHINGVDSQLGPERKRMGRGSCFTCLGARARPSQRLCDILYDASVLLRWEKEMRRIVPILIAVAASVVSTHALAEAVDTKNQPIVRSIRATKPVKSTIERPIMNAHATHPKFKARIAVGSMFSGFYVVSLAFSPDSRYLAVGDAGSATIVTWDLERNKEQARFKVAHLDDSRRGGPRHMHWRPEEFIIWSPDGRFVTTGIGRAEEHGADPLLPIELWDPMTGKLAHALDAYSNHTGAFNRDGSKLLNIASDGNFSIFDTTTWRNDHPAGSDLWFDTGMPGTEGYGWTADNKVLMVGHWSGQLKNRQIPHFELGKVPPLFSSLIQKIDPTGKESIQIGRLGYPVPNDTNEPNRPFTSPSLCHGMDVSLAGNKAALRCGLDIWVVDTTTLQTLFIHRESQDSLIRDGGMGLTFSADGKYLYLLAHSPQDKDVDSLILDATTGEQVGSFPSGESWGLAISPDGKTMAVGHREHVELFDLQ